MGGHAIMWSDIKKSHSSTGLCKRLHRINSQTVLIFNIRAGFEWVHNLWGLLHVTNQPVSLRAHTHTHSRKITEIPAWHPDWAAADAARLLNTQMLGEKKSKRGERRAQKWMKTTNWTVFSHTFGALRWLSGYDGRTPAAAGAPVEQVTYIFSSVYCSPFSSSSSFPRPPHQYASHNLKLSQYWSGLEGVYEAEWICVWCGVCPHGRNWVSFRGPIDPFESAREHVNMGLPPAGILISLEGCMVLKKREQSLYGRKRKAGI